jgi:hypothetical protein
VEDPAVTALRTSTDKALKAAYETYLREEDYRSGPATLTWFHDGGFRLTPKGEKACSVVMENRQLGKLAEQAETALTAEFPDEHVINGFRLVNELEGKIVCTYDADNYSESNRWLATVTREGKGMYSYAASSGCSTRLEDHHIAYYTFTSASKNTIDDLYTPAEQADIKAFFRAFLHKDYFPKNFM